MKFYGFKNKMYDCRFIGVSAHSNEGGEFCNSTGAAFDTNCIIPWITDTEELIDSILNGTYKVEWYNSDIEKPELSKFVRAAILEEYEVFEVEI